MNGYTLGSTVVVYDYTHDLAGRLETVSVDGKEVSRYGFDSNGNRLSRVTPEGSVSGTYDAQDRMLSYGPCSWSYDGHGDTQARTCSANRGSAAEARFPAGETRYRYDVFSNLRRVEMPDGRVIEYLIDGSNRRVGRLVNGQLTQRLIYKDQLEPIAEFDGAGQLKAWFIYADRAHVPTLMLKPENGSEVAYRLIADHLGSVRLVVRLQDGAVVQRIDYDEYGVVLSDSNPGFQPFGYAGGIDDREAGLVRFGARDYDPLTGRWLIKDPIGFRGGLNSYGYVNGSPINFVDPLGLSEMDVLRIVNRFGETVDEMTKGGLRDPSPFFNNQKRRWGKWTGDRVGDSRLLDCGEQADYVNDKLRDDQYDDSWDFYLDAGFGHAWGLAISQNPDDPKIWYDPRSNSISVGKPCNTCKGWFGDRTFEP